MTASRGGVYGGQRQFRTDLDRPSGDQVDAEKLDQLMRQLWQELREFDVEWINPVSANEPPEGAKAGEVIALGCLAVAVLPTLLPKLVDFLQGWVLRRRDDRVKVKVQSGNRSVEMTTARPLTPSLISEHLWPDLPKQSAARVTRRRKAIRELRMGFCCSARTVKPPGD